MASTLRTGVLAYHPSKSPEANALLSELKARLNSDYPGFQLWAVGSQTDLVMEIFERLEGPQTFEIIPLLLFPGQHFQMEVRALAEELQAKRRDIDVQLAPCILERANFLDALLTVV